MRIRKTVAAFYLCIFGAGFTLFALLTPFTHHTPWYEWHTVIHVLIGLLLIVGGIILRRKAMIEYRQRRDVDKLL